MSEGINMLLAIAVIAAAGLIILSLGSKKRRRILNNFWIPQSSKSITAKPLFNAMYFSIACASLIILFVLPRAVEAGIAQTAHVRFLPDSSKSMAAESPLGSENRLDRTEAIIEEICDAFPDMHTSLYAFTEIARSHAYFSESSDNKHNCGYIKKTLNNVLVIESTSEKGSNIADAILMASSSFPKEAKSRVLILFTDGEYTNPDKEFVQALSAVKKRGISLIVVGVGEEKGAYIPIYNNKAEIVDVERNSNGAKIITALRSETLRTIAKEAGGEYFEENEKEKLFAEINANLVQERENLPNFYSSWESIFLVALFFFSGLLFLKSVV